MQGAFGNDVCRAFDPRVPDRLQYQSVVDYAQRLRCAQLQV